MEETAASNPTLQMSISFGRFENDSLSWEKWSVFSQNKYLEEVEKCAAPGSVAQKKAYFEAHYKNIAARKAELLAQEKQMEKEPFGSQYQNGEDLSCNTFGTVAEFNISSIQSSVEGVKPETNSIGEIIRTQGNNLEEDVAVSRDYQSSTVKGENEELESRSHSSHIDKPEEVVCTEQEERPNIEAEVRKEISHNVDNETAKAPEIEAEDVKLDHPKVEGENEELESRSHSSQIDKPEEVVYTEQEERPNIEAEVRKEISHNVDNETAKASEIEAKDVKLDHSKVSKKVTPVNRESNAAKMKKKSVLPTSKASQISTQSSRPISTSTKTLASASSTKRGNFPSLSGRKITSNGENRKVPNKSLHMSLSVAPSKLDPGPLTTMRKSSFMEKMGDKDIVKRAFKTFQNNFNLPKTSGEEKSLVKTKVPSRGLEPRVSTSRALRKENEQSPKVDSMDKRSGNAIRTSLGLKSDTRAYKGKEVPRKLEEKSNVKQVERTHLQLKSEEEKLKHNFKATPLPAFYRGQKVSKSHPEKGNVKIEKWR